MREQIKAVLSILVLTAFIVTLYFVGYIPYDRIVSKQIEDFDAMEVGRDAAYFGSIQPQIVDGFTEKPIEGAIVVIPEIDEKYVTAKDGLTPEIKIPVIEEMQNNKIIPRPWGEITILVYKEGYIEYALFNAHVWENRTRKGPKILLFPSVEGEQKEPFAVQEGPHRVWVKQLVEKYKP